jgi:energy-coupling factor transporter ATP-binding protein EcfA2/ABC-type dipeptide/oligopeptide/nickel transport system ATPase component
MKFTYFKFINFKGIKNQKLDLSKNPNSKVFSLVGLNESGKTTILEAINYFTYKPETLDALELESYQVDDIHNLIPINKRDNFNETISVEAGIELESDDIVAIRKNLKENADIYLTKISSNLSYTQNYYFKDSIHQKEKNRITWEYDFIGRKGKSTNAKKISNEDAQHAHKVILKRMPSILYFPNFLFEFPEKIYLDPLIEEKRHKFFQTIIQDVLDSLDNNTNIAEHLIKRIESSDEKEKRNLNSLIGKMQRQLSDVIFKRWNQIFKKEISRIEIILFTGKDDKGPFIEFNIKDDVDTYRIIERSLGFRWFFVYILLTQFRSFRKQNKNVLFLFDEPASNLHPSAQLELLKSFERLPRVLYTTHSHYLINPKWLENTFVIKNEAIDYENEQDYNLRNTDIKINKYRDFAVKYPEQSSYFQPILEVLDYRPSNIELVPNVVITEGKNDYYTYNYIQKVILKRVDEIKFVPGASSSNLETLISLYMGWGAKFIVLLDSDDEGIKQKKRYEEIFGNEIANSVVTYANINSEMTNFETEDVFSRAEQLLIQAKNYPMEPQFNKKLFNRSVQELFINNDEMLLSIETKTKFLMIFDYLVEHLD